MQTFDNPSMFCSSPARSRYIQLNSEQNIINSLFRAGSLIEIEISLSRWSRKQLYKIKTCSSLTYCQLAHLIDGEKITSRSQGSRNVFWSNGDWKGYELFWSQVAWQRKPTLMNMKNTLWFVIMVSTLTFFTDSPWCLILTLFSPPQSHTEPVWVTSPFFLLSFLWDWSALRGKRGKKSFSNPFIFSGSIQIKGLGITKGLPIRFNKGRPVVEPASNFSVSRLQSSCICQRARRQTWKAFCLICLVNRSFTYMNLKGSTNVVHQNQLTCRGNASQPL